MIGVEAERVARQAFEGAAWVGDPWSRWRLEQSLRAAQREGFHHAVFAELLKRRRAMGIEPLDELSRWGSALADLMAMAHDWKLEPRAISDALGQGWMDMAKLRAWEQVFPELRSLWRVDDPEKRYAALLQHPLCANALTTALGRAAVMSLLREHTAVPSHLVRPWAVKLLRSCRKPLAAAQCLCKLLFAKALKPERAPALIRTLRELERLRPSLAKAGQSLLLAMAEGPYERIKKTLEERKSFELENNPADSERLEIVLEGGPGPCQDLAEFLFLARALNEASLPAEPWMLLKLRQAKMALP